MSGLPENLFANPTWHALHTSHRRFALSKGLACRYPADIAPFVAVAEPSEQAMADVRALMTPGESIWVIGNDLPPTPELSFEEELPCLQMILPADVSPPDPAMDLIRLSEADAPEMVALTDLAFPGFFRIRTCEMGSYWSVRRGGELAAMGGERLMIEGYAEISGLCTHPAHRGEGLATEIIWQLVRDHRRDGLVSWLHVAAANIYAIDLYRRLGFEIVREVTANRLKSR